MLLFHHHLYICAGDVPDDPVARRLVPGLETLRAQWNTSARILRDLDRAPSHFVDHLHDIGLVSKYVRCNSHRLDSSRLDSTRLHTFFMCFLAILVMYLTPLCSYDNRIYLFLTLCFVTPHTQTPLSMGPNRSVAARYAGHLVGRHSAGRSRGFPSHS